MYYKSIQGKARKEAMKTKIEEEVRKNREKLERLRSLATVKMLPRRIICNRNR